MTSYLAIGLVVKDGEQFIDKWIQSAEKIGDCWFIIDNGLAIPSRQKLINHPNTKRYLIQKDLERNMSRDYQKILEMAREEDCNWIWNLDIDEVVPEINHLELLGFLLNSTDDSIGFPLLEMRGDDKHFVMIKDCSTQLKHARICHKCYKVLSHFKFNEKDKHGVSIPHNCKAGGVIDIFIQHFGHYTKELREEKRQQYKTINPGKDFQELDQSWMEDDDSKVVIKEWGDWEK